MPEIIWKCQPFEALSLHDLYAILQLRQEVFIVEQNCPFLDADGKDFYAWHLQGFLDDKLVAYTRLLPLNQPYESFTSIGRVVSSPQARNIGAGRLLMQKSIQEIERLFGKQAIKIGAQQYLQKFYESFGFQQSSEPYLEDDIWHIEMIRTCNDELFD